MPPRRVNVDGCAEDAENRRHGSDTCRRRVVDPAVPGSAAKLPGREMPFEPGANSMVVEVTCAPIRVALDISAASFIPDRSH